MLEKEIKKIMENKDIQPMDIYKPLKINRVNFYKAIKTSNLKNKSLVKILDFLGYEISLTLIVKKNENKKNKKL